MWKVTINSIESGIIDVTATEDCGFSFSSRIKSAEIQMFIDKAKSELLNYQELHKDDNALKSQIETLLNS